MGIPDGRPKNYWGYWYVDQPRYTQLSWRDWDGRWIIDPPKYTPERLSTSVRAGKSTNRRRPVNGTTGASWIPPSSYNRSVARYDFLARGHRYTKNSQGAKMLEWYTDPWIGGMIQHVKGTPEFWPYGLSDHSCVISVNKRARLITECLLKIKDQKLNLSENLATALQTYNMFAKNSSTFFRSIIAAKHGRWKDVARELGLTGNVKTRGSVSSRYLEYIYGWKPLMQDIYGGWELLNEQLPFANFVHAVRKLSKSYEDSYISNDVGGSRKWHINAYAHGYDKLSLTGKISDEYARSCARAGLINPASVAWEVVPFSFLIDWGMPIGNCLEAMDATRGLDFVGGYFSTRGEGTFVSAEQNYDFSNVDQWVVETQAMASCMVFSNQREKVNKWPFPQPYVKSPFSTGHALNALALFRQMTRR